MKNIVSMKKYLTEKILLPALLVWSLVVYLVIGLIGPANFWEHFTGRNYLNLAESILQGKPFMGVTCCMPLYPLTLAGMLAVFDHASLPLLLLHTAIGVAIVYFT